MSMFQLHAEYNPQNDEYLAHRVVQAFDTAQFIKLTSSPSELSLIGGDLNTEPKDLAYRIIKNTAELNDAHDDCPVRNVSYLTFIHSFFFYYSIININ